MCHWTSAAHRIGLKKFKKGNKVKVFFISTSSQPQAKLWFNTKPSNFLQITDFQIRHNVRVNLQVLNSSHALNNKHISFQTIYNYTFSLPVTQNYEQRPTKRPIDTRRGDCLPFVAHVCWSMSYFVSELHWTEKTGPILLCCTWQLPMWRMATTPSRSLQAIL